MYFVGLNNSSSISTCFSSNTIHCIDSYWCINTSTKCKSFSR